MTGERGVQHLRQEGHRVRRCTVRLGALSFANELCSGNVPGLQI